MTPINLSIAAAIVILAAGIVVILIRKQRAILDIENAKAEGGNILDKARKEGQRLIDQAYNESDQIKSKARREVENEVKSRTESLKQIEKRLFEKEQHLDNRDAKLTEKSSYIDQEHERIKDLRRKQEKMVEDLSAQLEHAAGFSKEDAKKLLLSNVEREVRQRAGQMIKQIEEQAKKLANRKAKEIVTNAIHRTAVNHVVPATTSTVQLPDDEMKGRIIGKEGRNIRAFEAVTGVDVIIDDSPNTVTLSAFDPIRREIAKMTMEALVKDGRIHPTRIEETHDKAKEELQEVILERGEKAAEELGLEFHPKLIELLGKLHYRTSYGQNMLQHAIETGHLAGIMAEELGVNINLAKRGGVLHDIGKALDFEQVGTHVDLGEEICRKYGESDEVINCINAHHEDEDPDTIEAVIVMMADAISSVRPGARRESVETYIKRLEKLESLAKSFDGVENAYAIQAGREIRVLVKPEIVNDDAAQKLAHDMAMKIEQELDYPGEVRVSIIRETRAVSIAH